MKILLTAALLLLSLSSLAQEYLLPESHETRNLVIMDPPTGFAVCQADQEILYSKYLSASRTQLLYLLEVMAEERPNSSRRLSYMEHLREKIILHILIDHMNKRMKSKSLFSLQDLASRSFQKSVIGLDGVRLELGEEISKTMDKVLTYRRFQEMAFEKIKEDLLKDTLKDLAKGALKAFISGAAQKTITKILAGTVTAEAFKKAIISTGVEMSTNILLGVAKSSLISVFTLPLHGYRYSDEDLWLTLTEKAPMLLLNPDWKVSDNNGPRAAHDWQVHCRTIIWKPEEVEYTFNKFLKNTEKRFYSSIQNIQTSLDFSNLKPVFDPAVRDGTYVRPRR